VHHFHCSSIILPEKAHRALYSNECPPLDNLKIRVIDLSQKEVTISHCEKHAPACNLLLTRQSCADCRDKQKTDTRNEP
jgi:hypothetical protein